MSHGGIFLLLVISLSCVAGDDTGAEYINFREVRPGDPDSTSDSLELKCSFVASESPVTDVQIMRLMEGPSTSMTVVTSSSVINSFGESVIEASGSLSNDGESTADATFVSSSDGYSTSYLCVVKGTTADRSRVQYYREIQVGAESVRPTIDTNVYNESEAYNGHVYIASKEAGDFELAEMNELCKASGGYLAEINDEAEREFIWNFVSQVGGQTFAIGGNDVENEGQFVYYNSGAAVPDDLWIAGEPNDFNGNEDCVEVKKRGLNDFKCTRSASYVCEIPEAELFLSQQLFDQP